MKRVILTGISACLLAASINANAEVEVNLNPVSLIFAAIDMDVLIDVNENIAVGPTVVMAKYTLGTDSVSVFSLGARGEYAFDGFDVSGVYSTVAMDYGTVSSDISGTKCSMSIFTADTLAGYAWRWDSGMNIKLGGGLRQTVYMADAFECDNGTTESTSFETEGINMGLGLELSIGKRF
ncbi:MAG: hypothetical protein HRU38_14100 [Saccharospirillaceae bacterium]|nr:hypothetical protein [Pseudomonadales bacterium]NRB79777.1 hypothetical protein [Saccharospirillaceae bacterium]